jgi:hypothetical protein
MDGRALGVDAVRAAAEIALDPVGGGTLTGAVPST